MLCNNFLNIFIEFHLRPSIKVNYCSIKKIYFGLLFDLSKEKLWGLKIFNPHNVLELRSEG